MFLRQARGCLSQLAWLIVPMSLPQKMNKVLRPRVGFLEGFHESRLCFWLQRRVVRLGVPSSVLAPNNDGLQALSFPKNLGTKSLARAILRVACWTQKIK